MVGVLPEQVEAVALAPPGGGIAALGDAEIGKAEPPGVGVVEMAEIFVR